MNRATEKSTEYKCLKAILATEKEQNFFVEIERFGMLLKWFGSLKQVDKNNEEINLIQIVTNAMKEDWFHGDLPRQNAEVLLNDFTNRRGTYLVRLSTTDIDKTPYTISKVNKKGTINHQRVYASRNGYYVVIKSKDDKDKRIESEGGIENLIESVTSELRLKHPCRGRKYNDIFSDKVSEGYLPSPEDEYDD